MRYFLTSDEHYFHVNIIQYASRPFKTVEEMNKKLIENNNLLVGKDDIVIHAGDFSFAPKTKTLEVIRQLKGNHIFLEGSHDSTWSKGITLQQIWKKKIEDDYIVVCHYAMRMWPKSHYGSYLAYGHSHGLLPGIGRSMDVGVDCWNYYPVPLGMFIEKLKDKPFTFDGALRERT